MIVSTAVVVGVLYAVGTYLLLQRQLTRIVIGLALMGHGANLLLLLAGGVPAGHPWWARRRRDRAWARSPIPCPRHWP